MLPVYFISHGAPTVVTRPSAARDFLKTMDLGRPRAVVMVSAHWETASPRVGAAARPRTIHDFGGFARELYELQYPAAGDPALAERTVGVLLDAGFQAEADAARGLDHGAWTPLMLMRPQADLPVVQVSIQPQDGPEGALRLGRALAPLRGEDVLIAASGALTHGLPDFDPRRADAPLPHVVAFTEWARQAIAAGDLEALLDYRARAPGAVRNHPEEEHLLPLYVAIGAGGLEGAERLHDSYTHGILAMDVYRFGGGAAAAAAA